MSTSINRFKKCPIDKNEKLNEYRSHGGVTVKPYFGTVNEPLDPNPIAAMGRGMKLQVLERKQLERREEAATINGKKKMLLALVFITNPSGGHRKATTPPLFELISSVPHHRFILRFLFTEPGQRIRFPMYMSTLTKLFT
ncbi:hypothetical protein AgCh_038642 [Apium graveolens]